MAVEATTAGVGPAGSPVRPAAGSLVRALVHPLVAVACTWPLVLHLGERIPLGTEGSATVPLFNLWTLRWEASRAAHGFAGFWAAPIFHPARGALAFSEVQPLTGAAFAALSWLTGNPVAAYGLVLIGALALDGWAGARLARALGVAPWPAALVGVLAQSLPFVANELGVLQLVMVWPLLVLVERVLVWSREGGLGPAVGAGAALAATFLTSAYYGLFALVVLGPAAAVLVIGTPFGRARVAEAVAGLGTAVALAGPVLVAQQRHLHAFAWHRSTVLASSAAPVDLVRLHGSMPGAHAPWLASSGGTGQHLWPGTVLVLLAAAGAWWARGDGGWARRVLGFTAVGLGLALAVSLGLRAGLGGFRPYEVLRMHVPGFSRLRSPFRAAVLVQLLLLVPASLGLDRLWRRPRAGQVAAVALVVVAVLEVAVVPLRLADVPPASTDWSRWLGARPDREAVAMVPAAPGPAAADFEPTVEAMLVGLDHAHPLVNGYSGFFPPEADHLEALLRGFPTPRSMSALRLAGVRWVVVDRSWLTPARRLLLQQWSPDLRPAFEGDDAVVYLLRR